MGYSNYRNLRTVVKKFNLDMQSVSLFADVQPVEPSDWLKETLRRVETALLTNEKAKAERVISPILTDVSESYRDRMSFFSGEPLNVRPEDDLAGECDFVFALHPPKVYIDAPVISLAEAKDEDMQWGIAQCAAQMLGARIFNERENRSFPFIYGCATDGIEWQFLKLENDIYFVDNKIFTDLPEILGVWHRIINFYL